MCLSSGPQLGDWEPLKGHKINLRGYKMGKKHIFASQMKYWNTGVSSTDVIRSVPLKVYSQYNVGQLKTTVKYNLNNKHVDKLILTLSTKTER